MRRLWLCLLITPLAAFSMMAQQPASTEQVQVSPPTIHKVQPPSVLATFEELEQSGDRLRGEKAYLDALDYYRAALLKKPNNAEIYNKIGIA